VERSDIAMIHDSSDEEEEQEEEEEEWGFKHFLSSPLLGEDSHFDSYFLKGVETTN